MHEAEKMTLGFEIEVVQGDVLTFEADVLVVKHSPGAGGLEKQVRQLLRQDDSALPEAGAYRVLPKPDGVRAEWVVIVGAPPVFALHYPQLRDLARRFLESLWEAGLEVAHMVTTLHGVRTGLSLDEVEVFRSLLLGLTDAYEAGQYPPALRRITFVERDANRVRVMQKALVRFLPGEPEPSEGEPPPLDFAASREAAPSIRFRHAMDDDEMEFVEPEEAERDQPPVPMPARPAPSGAAPPAPAPSSPAPVVVLAGVESFKPAFRGPTADETTPHVFVAMPFREDYDDQYYLAIQPSIHAHDLLAERMDLDAFTGDIKVRMLERIRSARLMIALLDGANPNVYLEVGYAWGVETPTILIAHTDEPLPFDVQGERILLYDRIYRLKDMLAGELARLLT